MKKLTLATLAALAAGMSSPALAQPAAAKHQHDQPTAPAQKQQVGPHKDAHGAGSQCDCCGMMKEMMHMMQTMRTMHQHGVQPGGVHKMDMMMPPASPKQDAKPDPAAEHQHETKPPK